MGRVVTKPVFGVPDKARLKPVSSATETSWKIEISPVASLHMILSIKRITKALIRLRGCAGWSEPVLLANPRRQVFSRRGPNDPWKADTTFECCHAYHPKACPLNLSLSAQLKDTFCNPLSSRYQQIRLRDRQTDGRNDKTDYDLSDF